MSALMIYVVAGETRVRPWVDPVPEATYELSDRPVGRALARIETRDPKLREILNAYGQSGEAFTIVSANAPMSTLEPRPGAPDATGLRRWSDTELLAQADGYRDNARGHVSVLALAFIRELTDRLRARLANPIRERVLNDVADSLENVFHETMPEKITGELRAAISKIREIAMFDRLPWPRWIKQAERIGDMDPECRMRLYREDDGDVILEVHNPAWDHGISIQFCTGQGGGRSPNVHRALCELMLAIEQDQAERPHRPASNG